MNFNRENGRMMLLALLLISSAAGMGWALANSRFHLSIILLALVLILFLMLFRRLTKTSREILFFFKALKNDDSSISYSASRSSKLIDELSGYLNELNRNFREMKVDQELREQYFMRILENLSGGLLVLAKTGHVNHINQQALDLFELPRLTHIKALKEVDQKLYGLIEGMKPGTKSKFGKALGLQCTGINLRGEDLRIITLQDLSVEMEQKEIDEWIRLIRVMSHEIMNSLAPITSISTTLKELWDEEAMKEPDPGPKINQTLRGLEAISEQSEGLTTFFESYRVLSRIPDPVKKKFPVCSMFEKLETLVIHNEENSGIRFSFQCSDPSMELMADEQMITQVMLNLVKNAAQALEGAVDPLIEISTIRKETETLLTVTDNGPGIPEEIADEIFLPFFTTREKGTGVGLSYSRQVMNLNGGSIDFESRKGHTSFRLSFRD